MATATADENVTKQGLISKTMTLQLRDRLWYISSLSSANQQLEMTKFKVLGRT